MKKGLYELVIIAIAFLMFLLFSIEDKDEPYFPSVTSKVSEYKPDPTTRQPTKYYANTKAHTESEDDDRVFDDDDDYDNPDYDQDEVDELENY